MLAAAESEGEREGVLWRFPPAPGAVRLREECQALSRFPPRALFLGGPCAQGFDKVITDEQPVTPKLGARDFARPGEGLDGGFTDVQEFGRAPRV